MFRPIFARLNASIARRRISAATEGRLEPTGSSANREARFMEAVSHLYSQGVGRGF